MKKNLKRFLVVLFIILLIMFACCVIRYNAQSKTEVEKNNPSASALKEVIKVMRLPSALTDKEERINVEVKIDKKGRVISAHALSGPLPLQDEAALLALKVKFDPKKKLTEGIIVFEFVPFVYPKILILPERASARASFL